MWSILFLSERLDASTYNLLLFTGNSVYKTAYILPLSTGIIFSTPDVVANASLVEPS